VLIVKEKNGILQSGDKPRLNMVAAACSSGRMSYEVGILKSWCKYLLVKMPLYFYGVTDLHTASRMYPLAFSLFQVSYTFPCVYVSQFLGV